MVSKRQFYRRGPIQRDSASVSFVDVRRKFGFRAISIGRWVTEAERDRAAGLFYDALADLMSILRGPEILISLRETLAFQYGIGGRPGTMAFYEPATRTFSLAKNAGPGSIAHEWFHALDHYLADKVFSDVGDRAYASEAWLRDATPIPHPLNDRLFACFRAIMLDETGENPSELFRVSVAADKANGAIYFSDPAEICARAFEAFVQDASISNNFLVSGTKATEEARMGLYPTGAHRQRINAAFSEYFSLLGYALRAQSERAATKSSKATAD
ncbi:CLCA_X family protein [Microbulbifer pacificus]|uniref:CLCA_X family protein n=1 Tax=Microbulbifer pacificus TaxID=407164 RepID=A0AAU0MXY9_9GAMM|nr:CLCA_X family protein [Microbulbifer pacificus]WOX05587.1 CLCA_X family protein [Microbulbifer pacificus]